ncbi:MAG: hypothetical protein IV089_04755 [Thiobacillus sp.]|nr:hypothetical protein [Thiobacillus sp.]
MRGIVEKLARGAARLAFWRRPVEASPQVAAPPAAVGPSPAEITAGPTPAAIVAPAQPAPLDPHELVEMLELSDPIAPSAQDAMLFDDDTPEEAVQHALASSEVAHANAVVETGQPEFESETAQVDIAQAEANQTDTAQPGTTSVAAVHVSTDAAPEAHPASQNPGLVSRLLGILSKKRVWIPGVSVAMLAVMASLSFMLMQSKQATQELQTELASARKQLRQAPIQPEVAPPVLVAHQDVAPHQSEPADISAEAVAREEATPQAVSHPEPAPLPAPAVISVASASQPPAPRRNIAMDCDISDKASVGKNLRNCIEAFNQATAR